MGIIREIIRIGSRGSARILPRKTKLGSLPIDFRRDARSYRASLSAQLRALERSHD